MSALGKRAKWKAASTLNIEIWSNLHTGKNAVSVLSPGYKSLEHTPWPQDDSLKSNVTPLDHLERRVGKQGFIQLEHGPEWDIRFVILTTNNIHPIGKDVQVMILLSRVNGGGERIGNIVWLMPFLSFSSSFLHCKWVYFMMSGVKIWTIYMRSGELKIS